MVYLKRIKDVAQKRGVTMASVAQAAGITPTGLSLIIRENTTKVETLEKIAAYLGVPVAYFFADDVGTLADPVANTAASDANMARALSILEGQLKIKDEQIGGLIKALTK